MGLMVTVGGVMSGGLVKVVKGPHLWQGPMVPAWGPIQYRQGGNVMPREAHMVEGMLGMVGMRLARVM